MTPEIRHMLDALKTSMRLLGYTNRDVERKLGLCSSYLSRLFSGGIDLKYSHVIEISRAMGIDPAELFHLVFPYMPEPPSPAVERIRQGLASVAPDADRPAAPPPVVPSEEQLEKLMAKTLRRFFSELAKAESG